MDADYSKNSVRRLEFSYKSDDSRDVIIGYLGASRHTSESPMMLSGPTLDGEDERLISMVTGVVEVVNERWPLVASASGLPMAPGTVFLERLLAGNCRLRKLRNRDLDTFTVSIRQHEL